MNNLTLKDIISSTESSPYIKWNDESLLELIKDNNVYNVFMFNKDGNHGYFSLLHNLTSNIDGTIVELGNREGLGILSVYDALKPDSEFYTLDIVDDVRFINDKIKNDSRVHILNDFDALDSRDRTRLLRRMKIYANQNAKARNAAIKSNQTGSSA